MKKLLLLLLLPVFGCVLIAAGFVWSRTELSVVRDGERTSGVIIAMVKARTNHADIIVGLSHQLTFATHSGEVIEVTLQNNQPVSVTVSNAAGRVSLPTAALASSAMHSPLPGNFSIQLWEVVRGDTEIIKRLLQRESKRTDDDRIVRIEKLETAHVQREINLLSERWETDGGTLKLPGTTSTVTTRAFFAPPVSDAGTNHNSWLAAYERTVDGKVTEPFRQDFIQFDEPYATEFRPVFQFVADGTNYARLSDIGRLGGPSPTYRLFEPCRLAYPPTDPGRAILLPHYGSYDARTSPLVWFSFAAEGFFDRWVFVCLLAGTGLGLIVMGIIVISLAVKPSVRLQDDAVANSAATEKDSQT